MLPPAAIEAQRMTLRSSRECRFEPFCAYLRALETSVNSLLMLVPRTAKEPMMKTAINEAISAYSIAVAPDSSAANVLSDLNMT